MKHTYISAAVCSACLMLCTACGSEPEKTVQTTAAPAVTTTVSTAAQTTAPVTTTSATVPADLEKAVFPEDGDAFLYFTDGTFYMMYDGKTASSAQKPTMCYNAGIAKITGDGKYTVSVTNDTKALRLDATKEVDGELKVKGCQFAAVIVKNGTVLYPTMCIEINEIRQDGKPVAMTAKNYTSSDDKTEMRANIYNQWVNSIPKDGHTPAGFVSGEFGEYSAQIIDPETIGEWKTIEVDFTVSGCSGPVATAAASTSAQATGTTTAGSTTSGTNTVSDTTGSASDTSTSAGSTTSTASTSSGTKTTSASTVSAKAAATKK